MILSDREIKALLERGAIKITPDPRDDHSVWSSTAIDLHLDSEIIYWNTPKGGAAIEFCPNAPDHSYPDLIQNFSQAHDISKGHLLKPNAFCLGWTKERISLPPQARVAARVEGKSGLARFGVGVHVTAPTIHAGFGYQPLNKAYPGSPIQLEIWHAGNMSIRIEKGMKVCQLIFELVDGTPEKGYQGKFNIQGPKK